MGNPRTKTNKFAKVRESSPKSEKGEIGAIRRCNFQLENHKRQISKTKGWMVFNLSVGNDERIS